MYLKGGVKNNSIVFPELSYKIMSVIFEVHNKIGNKWREIDFCNAIETVFKKNGISYKREETIDLKFEGSKFAKCRLDFIIADKIILEVKKIWRLGDSEVKQALRYLETTNLKLAIIINFKHKRIDYIRVINSNIK